MMLTILKDKQLVKKASTMRQSHIPVIKTYNNNKISSHTEVTNAKQNKRTCIPRLSKAHLSRPSVSTTTKDSEIITNPTTNKPPATPTIQTIPHCQRNKPTTLTNTTSIYENTQQPTTTSKTIYGQTTMNTPTFKTTCT